MLKFDLHKTFLSKKRITTISCKGEFELGGTAAIYGKSGVGKSTVLRLIAGLDSAEHGSILFKDEIWYDADQKINRPIAERNIGFVFQEFNLFRNMTVEGNLKYASPGKKIAPEIEHLLGVTDLMKLLQSKPQELSGGEKQRVSILRALCQKPELLLLDEPFSALDDDAIWDLIRETRTVQKEMGTTIVMVSHRKDVILEMAQSVVLMKTEGTTEQGLPADLLERKF